MNQEHLLLKNEIEKHLQKFDYDKIVVYELIKKAIETGMPYDTLIQDNLNYAKKFELIQFYFLLTPLKDFKSQEQFYIQHKDKPSFIALLFLADRERDIQNKPIEKAKLLLDWGYDVNATLSKPYLNSTLCYEYSEVGLTPLHYAITKPYIEYLIQKGADLEATANCASEYSIKLLVDSGIQKIKSSNDWQSFFEFDKEHLAYKKKYTMDDLKAHYKQPNKYLSLYQQNLTPLELAKHFRQKGKIVLLEKAALINPQEHVDNILELMKQGEYKKATRLFNLQVKINNEALFEQLEQFKDLTNKIITQENIILQFIYQQKIEWFKKAQKLNMIDNHTTYPYLLFAAQQHKTLMFIHLYEHGYENEIDLVGSYINDKIKWYKNNPLQSEHRDEIPLLIIRYLMNKDYIFEHQYFIEEAIKKEKARLDELLENEVKASKKRKI
jgi:hypothetical protein